MAAGLMMKPVQIRPPGKPAYPVYFGESLQTLVRLVLPSERRRVAIIGDAHTAVLHGAPLMEALRADGHEVFELWFEAGERAKIRATKERLENQLLEHGVDRDDLLIAVGGGVTTDMVGFIAATYHRGMNWLAAPTSLLAQVDAAIGGKTGLNTPAGKNLIGAVHHPEAVLIASETLETLPADEYRQGWAEAIKHGLIRDAVLFERLERLAERGAIFSEADLRAVVAVKAAVASEEDEDRGLRAILNAGHTVAHAIEQASDHAVPHGDAVAIGLHVEARVAEGMQLLPSADRERLVALLERVGLPVVPEVSFERALPYFFTDKKSRAGSIRCALPRAIGAMAPADSGWTHEVEPDRLRHAWDDAV